MAPALIGWVWPLLFPLLPARQSFLIQREQQRGRAWPWVALAVRRDRAMVIRSRFFLTDQLTDHTDGSG